MNEELTFEIVHAIRVRGFAAGPAVEIAVTGAAERVTAELRRLSERELVRHREVGGRAGWLLTAEGLRWHGTSLSARSDPAFVAAVDAGYSRFLDVNRSFKELCSDWQMAGSPVEAAAELAVELREFAATVHLALRTAATQGGWFATYSLRLESAIARFEGGEAEFLINPRVDSVHTIWGECHEDFLVSLTRERDAGDE